MQANVVVIAAYGIGCFLAGSVLFKKAAGTLGMRRPNIITLVYYVFIVQFLLAAFLETSGSAKGYFSMRAVFDDSVVKAFYATYGVFVLLPLFVILLQRVLHIHPKKEGDALFKRPWKTVTDRSDSIIILGLFIGGAVVSIIFLGLMLFTDMPLKNALKANVTGTELAIARHQWVWGEEKWVQYVRNIVGGWLTPLMALISFVYWLMHRSFARLALFLWLSVVACLFLLSSLAKGPILFYFLLPIAYVYGLFCGGFRGKQLGLLSLAVIAAAVVLYSVTLRTPDLKAIIPALLERVFFGQYSGTVLTFDMFPRLNPFLGLSGFFVQGPWRLLGGEGTRYSVLLMQQYYPEGWAAERAGYMSTLFIAEGYACFGIIGILLSVFIVALWLTVLQWLWFRVRLQPVSVAFLGLLTFWLISFVGDGLLVFLYPSGVLIVALTVYLLILCARGKPVFRLVRYNSCKKRNAIL